MPHKILLNDQVIFGLMKKGYKKQLYIPFETAKGEKV